MVIYSMKDRIPQYFKAEEEVLNARLKCIRAAINHSGEKGRSVEHYIMELIRDFLPSEYGLDTGFIMYHTSIEDNKIDISSQIDIIIYDALRSGPIMNLGSCRVYPIESVYGYIEVKTSIGSTKLKECVEQSKKLRDMKIRKFYIPISRNRAIIQCIDDLPIRSFFFALGREKKFDDKIEEIISSHAKEIGDEAHIHGMYVAESGYYESKSCESNDDNLKYSVSSEPNNALALFKWKLLYHISRFPRYNSRGTPAVDLYFNAINKHDDPIVSSATASPGSGWMKPTSPSTPA